MTVDTLTSLALVSVLKVDLPSFSPPSNSKNCGDEADRFVFEIVVKTAPLL